MPMCKGMLLDNIFAGPSRERSFQSTRREENLTMKHSSYVGLKAMKTSLALILMLAAQGVFAQSFNYITPADLKQRLQSAEQPFLLDIQVEKEYVQHHLPGAVPTYAYPVKSDGERAALKPAVANILATNKDVVIICPGGGQGAKNAFTFLKKQGVPQKRMRILEKGQRGWPYPELLSSAR